jgi:hypothetical protein
VELGADGSNVTRSPVARLRCTASVISNRRSNTDGKLRGSTHAECSVAVLPSVNVSSASMLSQVSTPRPTSCMRAPTATFPCFRFTATPNRDEAQRVHGRLCRWKLTLITR